MKLLVAMLVVLAWVLSVLLAFQLDLHPDAIDLKGILAPPDIDHWLGRDDLGRSVADRLLSGAQTSLTVSLSVTLLSALVGVTVGSAAAWLGGFVDHVLIRIIDLFMAFPGILLAIALAGILGPGINNLIIALSLVGWVGFARLTRAQMLALKQRDHVLAAQALGVNTPVIITRHLLPLVLAALIVEATFSIASIIIAEAGLSFLGIGIQAPAASWGNMIRDGSRYMLVAPHLVIAPGVVLASVVLSVNMLGDQLRDHLDRKSRYLT